MAYAFDPTIIARLLQGSGAALTAYGSGQNNWGGIGAQAIGQADQQQQQQREQALHDTLLRQQIAQQQQQMADAAAQKAAATKAFGSLLPGQSSAGVRNQQTGGYDLTPGSGTSPLDSLPPAVSSYIKSRGAYDPAGALDVYGQVAMEKPDTSAPTTKDFNVGGNVVTKQWDPNAKAWVEMSSAPRWQPIQPPQLPADIQAWMLDRKNDPDNPAFKTIAGWRKYQQAGNGPVTYGDPVTGDAAKQLGFDPNGTYQKGSDGKWYTAQAPKKAATTYGGLITGEAAKDLGLDPAGTYQQDSAGRWISVTSPAKPSVTYQTLTGDALKALNPNLDPTKTWKVGSDGSAAVVDKPSAAAGKAITGDDAKALNLDPTGTYQQRPDGTFAVLVKPRAEGVYGGNAIDAQDSNIILKGQTDEAYRATPEYALAWNRQYEQQKIQQVQDPTDPTKFTLVAIPPVKPVGLKPPSGIADPNAPTLAAPAPGAPAAASQPAAPVPANSRLPTATPIPGTTSQKQLNGEQALSKGFAKRMTDSNTILSQPAATAAGINPVQGFKSSIPGIGNYLVSDNRQKLEQAERDFINAQLRRESGAAISSGEFDNARQQYFPQPGDSDAVLAQKAANRQNVIDGMNQSASPYPLPATKSKSDLYSKYGLTPAPAANP